MNWPVPQPGFVIRYSYLWAREAREGREAGVKGRPCAIVLVLLSDNDKTRSFASCRSRMPRRSMPPTPSKFPP